MILTVSDWTEATEGVWLSSTISKRHILVETISGGVKADGVTWKISLDNGVTWGSNNPDFDDGNAHMAKLGGGYSEGDPFAIYVLSDDTTTGLDGTEMTFTAQEGDYVLVEWTVEDLDEDTADLTTRIRHDTISPDAPTVKVYKDDTKEDSVSDSGWTNESQPYIEFEWTEERSGLEEFSYTVSGSDPDTTAEKDFSDPNFDMTEDPDPSN